MRQPLGPLPTKEEALKRLFARWDPRPGTEMVPLDRAAGRVLAEDVTARYDIPVVRASAMDGVAVSFDALERGEDPARWRLGEE